jgi:hypothetical protein
MSDGGTTEIIWHFAGYLRLFEDTPADRVTHDPFGYETRSVEYHVDLTPDGLPRGDLPELGSKAIKVSLPVAPAASLLKPFAAPTLQLVEAPETVHTSLGAVLAKGPLVGSGVAPASYGYAHGKPLPSRPDDPSPPEYGVTYEAGANDKLAAITQTNLLSDVDALIGESGVGLSGMHPLDIPEALTALLGEARAATPEALVPAGQTPLDWKNLVAEHDAALRENGNSGGAQTEAGTYVNGALVESEPSEPPARPEPPETGGAGTQFLETGGNKAINIAVLADLNEAAGTLVVLGDYFETNAIVQANVYSDRDQVLPESAHSAQALTGNNLALNVATFVADQIEGRRGDKIGSDGLKVDVTIADGDVFDVKALVQRNWILDNDEAVQSASDGYSAAFIGGNEQGNAARFLDIGNYDVIIVLGDYHDFNLISQTNVLIDDDILGATTAEEIGETHLHGGRNHLVNEAAIENYGARGFDSVTDHLEDLIGRLGRQEQASLDDWSGFAGSATGNLSVLLVRGDYWDINVVTQTNVIVDADVALQHLPGGRGDQWLASGGNDAKNVAKIIDVGGVFDQYLGGEHYTDAILIQAEYVDASSAVLNPDTLALVSEAVAFSGLLDEVESHDDAAVLAKGIPSHDDMMGSVLV